MSTYDGYNNTIHMNKPDLNNYVFNHSKTCTTIIVDIFNNFEWIQIDCERVFEHVLFTCKFRNTKYNNVINLDPQVWYCNKGFTYFHGLCIKLYNIIKREVSSKINKFTKGMYHHYVIYRSKTRLTLT